MKTTLMIIGTLFLISSCTCFKIKKDVRVGWSTKFNECRCQWYSFRKAKNETKFIPCEDFYAKYFPKKPILPNAQYCDDLLGFSKESWAKNITPRARETIACFEDEAKSCAK